MNPIVPNFRQFGLTALLTVLVGAVPSALGQTILNSWAGMADRGVPPDPHGAAGPNGILQTVNTSIQYFDKSGGSKWGPTGLTGFWSNVGNSGQNNSDPKAIYDQRSGRFYVVMQESLAAAPFTSFLNLAVSKTADPTNSGPSQWFFYRVDMSETVAGNPHGGDYPGLAVDKQAVYVTYNMLKLSASGSPDGPFWNSQIFAFNKASINSGVLGFNRVFAAPGISWNLTPVSVIGDEDPGNRAFFVQVSLPSSIALWSLLDPLGTPILSAPYEFPVLPNGDIPGPGAPQAGTATLLDTIGEQLRAQGNASWLNGSIWFCYTGAPLFQSRTRVYYYQIVMDGCPPCQPVVAVPNLVDPGFIDGGAGVWSFQPAIGQNACGDVCLVYCESSATEFPRIMCAVRPRGASTFGVPFVVKQSPSPYNGASGSTGGPARWGDYASVSADPTDGSFWITHEWARSSASDDWGTWWAQVAITPPPPRDLFVNSQFCVFRTGAKDCTAIPPAGPLATVREGIRNAFCGDTVNIRTGSYNEQLSTTKSVRLQAYDGPVTIGQ